MRVALIGSADFGKAALEAFLDRGDEIVAVFCPPDNPKSTKPEVLKEAALAKGLTPLQFSSLKGPDAAQAMIDSNADICVMAYVLQFVPQELVKIPKHGTIQYHPSLLPKYRGPSAINWAIVLGEEKTGLTIFRPSDGLDEGGHRRSLSFSSRYIYLFLSCFLFFLLALSFSLSERHRQRKRQEKPYCNSF